MKTNIRKDDEVIVLAGKERGKRGKVIRVLPRKGRVIVEQVNTIKRHTRPNMRNPQGGIIEREAPIHLSNVNLYCNSCGKGVRIGQRVLEDGSKVRVCKSCGEQI
ncbi:MAG: 50S ribosomal protein L24 [Alphaproteobacteria bacterium CG_4_10_14_0_2_um_filter_63_37]|nr:MAG: 50S ribosomal protein L24 [Proteobacteria bacterium CG1_02_64_396]PJA25563.1 MAG: 50S ribosomal protein L24 [Alphaproteobacteria bacterium CG_4_10_14_0_2_um_filter_63_37]